MAMIQCSECGNWISDRAYSCPHCGCPVYEDDEYENGYQHERGAIQARTDVYQENQARKRVSNRKWRIYCIVMSLVMFFSMYSFGSSSFSTNEFYTIVIFVICFIIIMAICGMAFWKMVILHLAFPHFLTFQIIVLSACAGYIFGSLASLR